MAAEGRTGAGAAQLAAHQTRDAKQPLSHEEVRERHQAMARVHGDQPQRVLAEAAEAAARRGVELRQDQSQLAAQGAVSYARERGMEREAVTDERSLMRDALKHTMGEARLKPILLKVFPSASIPPQRPSPTASSFGTRWHRHCR